MASCVGGIDKQLISEIKAAQLQSLQTKYDSKNITN
jgi:hypothetical protein